MAPPFAKRRVPLYLTKPDRHEPLRTDGLYSRVRHPLMFCDAFWPLGFSLILGSVIGILLTPVWFLLSWCLTYLEEEALVREYGPAYQEFQARVPRLIPRVWPFRGRERAA